MNHDLPAATPTRFFESRLTRRAIMALPAVAGVAALAGCSIGGSDKNPVLDLIAYPDKDIWPERFKEVPLTTQETYRFAVVNQETLQWFACYCGCVDTDQHKSNFDCYVQEVYGDGSILLDTHSFS